MRPPLLPRLLRVNQTVCIRHYANQKGGAQRMADEHAQEEFIEKAASTSPQRLLKSPQRDTHTYDKKPSVQFSSPAISALHARIGLPETFPLSTLQRCLTDPSMERDHALHNEALSVLGTGLLEYYVAEYLCVRWPRLTMKTQLASLWAYTGESALARIAREWGVKSGTLSKAEQPPDPPSFEEENKRKEARRWGEKPDEPEKDWKGPRPWKIDTSIPHLPITTPSTDAEKLENELGINMEWESREQAKLGWLEPGKGSRVSRKGFVSTLNDKEYERRFVLYSLQRFVQSLVGGVYVHSGLNDTKTFIKAHILSRTLPPLSSLYLPQSPAQELTRLCERLNIPLPISRLVAESGRHTRVPVFVVGVFSGREKLGEGQGSSLKEAKARANTNALRAWYLYEQAGWEFAVPSRTEEVDKTYVMGYVDPGSIVI